jgi:hypothetical protein
MTSTAARYLSLFEPPPFLLRLLLPLVLFLPPSFRYFSYQGTFIILPCPFSQVRESVGLLSRLVDLLDNLSDHACMKTVLQVLIFYYYHIESSISPPNQTSFNYICHILPDIGQSEQRPGVQIANWPPQRFSKDVCVACGGRRRIAV